MTESADEPAVDHHAAAHRATEFVYGTVAVLIVIAGIDISGVDLSGSRASAAPVIIMVAAIATWLAHAYAETLGRQLTTGHSTRPADIGRALSGSFPIVLAALPATAVSIAAMLGFWTPRTSVVLANILALLVLAAAGWFAARGSGDTRLQSLVSAVVSTSIGAAIVAMELLVYH